jgi:hypothetical protein
MKDHFEKLGQLALQSASSAGRGLTNVQNLAQDITQVTGKDVLNKAAQVSSLAMVAGKSVQQSLVNAMEHETTVAMIEQVKEKSLQLADSATHGAKLVGNQVVDGMRKVEVTLEEHHLEIKEKTETVSMGFGIAAGVATGAAMIGTPILVAAAPVIGVAATVTGAVAGGAHFYSKWKTKKAQANQNQDDVPNPIERENESENARGNGMDTQ